VEEIARPRALESWKVVGQAMDRAHIEVKEVLVVKAVAVGQVPILQLPNHGQTGMTMGLVVVMAGRAVGAEIPAETTTDQVSLEDCGLAVRGDEVIGARGPEGQRASAGCGCSLQRTAVGGVGRSDSRTIRLTNSIYSPVPSQVSKICSCSSAARGPYQFVA